MQPAPRPLNLHRIAVVALGHIGLPVAAYYASLGHTVIGCDVDARVVDAINRGESPLHEEPELPALVADAVAAGRLRATTDTAAAVHASDVVIVVPPMLASPEGGRDYRAMDAAFLAVGDGLQPGSLVILETTVPAGDTRRRFLPLLEARSGLQHGRDFWLAFSPERVQSRTLLRDLRTYPRIVGALDAEGGQRAAEFYRESLDVEVRLLASAEAAELCKLAESIFRDVNIALANELAMYADELGIDFEEVRAAANSQPQSMVHVPGIGVGGHCIPVYPWFLIGDTEHGRLARAARRINDAMPAYAVDLLERHAGPLRDRPVLILGLGYRPGVRQAAHSPAIALSRLLRERGARPLVHDPLFSPEELRDWTAAEPADLAALPPLAGIILQTAHPEYRAIDWPSVPGQPMVLDGRRGLDAAALRAAGLTYVAIGSGARERAR